MLALFGDLKISTVFGPKHNCFITRFLIFCVQVALNATTLACGNKERSSPTKANHFLKACLFSPLMSSPLKNKGPHDHDVLLYNYCGIIFIRGGQCSWTAKIVLVHGDVI